MNEKDLIKELEEEVKVPENVEFEEEKKEIEEAKAPEKEIKIAAVNALQFGQIITNLYCSISDFAYKKIKKSDTAPEWSDEEKQSVNAAFEGYLSTVNLPLTPLTTLLMTLATCELMRYTIK